MDTSGGASPQSIVRQVLAFMLGVAHQPPMVPTISLHSTKTKILLLTPTQLIAFVLYNLCRYHEYIQPLRDEVSSLGESPFSNQNHDMPYLDSFLKETARFNPLTDSRTEKYQTPHSEQSSLPVLVALPRKAMSPFTFADGTHVPKNNWVCVPHLPLMTDPATYADP